VFDSEGASIGYDVDSDGATSVCEDSEGATTVHEASRF
jgi:hypothetical protein